MNSEERILIRVYGDSLTCPNNYEGIMFYDVYPELLADQIRKQWPKKKVTLTTRSRPDTSIVELYKDTYYRDTVYFGKDCTDITIIHCGICDCAPRPIPRWMRDMISQTPVRFRSQVVSFLHNNRARILRSIHQWRLTRPEIFAQIYLEWLQKVVNQSKIVFAINIAPTIPEIENHSPGLGESILIYNHIINDAFGAVNADNLFLFNAHQSILNATNGLREYIIQSDGHHLTKAGNKFYAEKLSEMAIPHLKQFGFADHNQKQ